MATVISDNITSPLGFTTAENLQAVRSGKSALRHFDSAAGVPFPFTASLFNEKQIKELRADGLTRFESLALYSIKNALQCHEYLLSGRCILVLSSTKGNIRLLKASDNLPEVASMGAAARKISRKLGLTEQPIVLSNACISGVSAIILASRLLEAGRADSVIVCGIDEQSPFILSGFESLKALSDEECRPFDIERLGLNLGEAAATMILSNQHGNGLWHIDEGVIRNDAYHISSPSPKGEGAYQSLMSVVKYADVNDIAVINAHGTATMYNDQMESMAIHRAGLSDVPVNALKGYFGHTMGAAGILETIMTMHSIDAGITLGTRNFEELGVSGTINISPSERNTDKSCFVKIISGFGGGNAGIVVSRKPYAKERIQSPRFHISHRVVMTDKSLTIDDKTQPVEASGDRLLTALYKERIGDYPRFYKMDSLSKLGFLATEILIKAENSSDCEHPTSRAIAFFNHKASLKTDIEYLETINDKDNFFPSPSLFVYTLPNIVTGEIAIRHHYLGETAFYILPERNWDRIYDIITCMFCDPQTSSIISGWIEYTDSNDFEANIFIANKTI